MNGYLIAAGCIAVITTLIHLIAGRTNPLRLMLDAELQPDAKHTMHGAWHAVTVNLVLSSMALFASALAPERFGCGGMLAVFVALQFVGYTAVFLLIATATRIGVAAMPQPALFIPIAVLSWVGR